MSVPASAYHRPVLETIAAKLLGWIPAPWSGVRLGHEASARLCTDGHPVAWIAGADSEWPSGPLHVDVSLKLWSRTEHRTTVRAIEATAASQQLLPYHWTEMTLDAGAKPEEQWPRLEPPEGEALRAKVGDVVNVKLLLTRGRPKSLVISIAG